jgi:hypothetical protein
VNNVDSIQAAALASPEYARAVRAVPAGRCTRGTGQARVLHAGERPGHAPDGSGMYEALLPLTTTGPGPEGPRATGTAGKKASPRGDEENRDPTRPFRWPLLAPATIRRARVEDRGRLTDAEAGLLRDNARALLDRDHPSEAISLLEEGIERAAHDPALQLQLRHLLGAALFFAGEYTRAAAVISPDGTQSMQFLDYVVPSSVAWRVVVRQLEDWLEQVKENSGGQ